jgi:hypothetical protein
MQKNGEVQLPFTRIHESDEYAFIDLGCPFMEFRLTYQGPLFANRSDDTRPPRLKHMHVIRTTFHRQLSELWNLDSRLKRYVGKSHALEPDGSKKPYSPLENLQKLYRHSGINWAPLVNETWGIVCGLDILFLRREPKGGIVQSGDLDNRIKTLFDAMAIPKENAIPGDLVSQSEPNPFFCLLSDDKLISEFRVTSDRLLTPTTTGNDEVHLIIGIRTFIADREKASMTLGQFFHE